MPSPSVSEVVVLAAGNGVRLSPAPGLPKPLVPVAGTPLLDHVLTAIATAGLSRVHIVTGCHNAVIREHVEESACALDVNWIHNPHYMRANGLSLLAARPHVRTPFLLLMADHLFETRTLRAFLEQPVADGHGLLAVDTKIGDVFDLPDATKAVTCDGAISALGKHLEQYDAIDTGMFIFDRSVFAAMEASVEAGDDSLTGGVNRLADQRRMHAWDIGDGVWIDIDTPDARTRADRLWAQGLLR